MTMVLDKMVKLQQENARICEKLDFVEDHNKHLLCELKKKSSNMQKHSLPGSKNGPNLRRTENQNVTDNSWTTGS
ncbi:unnamed protein product [Macrosiphum euphorbiae]|uniref:Uncharacterized protein n=1 Tax=Macrosiphum euphorbiae TaxID=13131 RepID=A0AAV0VHI7_9HEMI|nr:unnamed protein product [Macrosiphum euphorbiae]